MAVANGYGKTVTSGSVFMYDTGDIINSYKGQPGTNITTGAGRNYNGYSRTTYETNVFFETNGYTEVVNIPALGPTTVQSVEINNSAPGYQCCPNLFNYTGGWMSPIWTAGQTYSYQIIYKVRSGYTHPNFMYHYEYNSSEGYITEYGVFDTNKQEHLGDGWYHAWNTFTANASAAKGYTGLWYYQYYVADKVSIAAVSITPGDTIRPPKQIIPSGTTRSATQGLLPIVGNSTINLSNVSFNSAAQMTFDGTDDYVSVTLPSSLSVYCLEMVWYNNNAIPNNDTVIGGPSTYQTPIEFNGNGQGVHLGAWTGGFANEAIHIWGPLGATANQVYAAVGYHHVVFNWNGTTYDIWVDGVNTPTQYLSGNNPATLITANSIKLGDDVNGYTFNGQIPITKIYNRALSASEVRQNYNKYKTRFNLP